MSAYIALSKPAWTLGLGLLCFLLFLVSATPTRGVRGYGVMDLRSGVTGLQI